MTLGRGFGAQSGSFAGASVVVAGGGVAASAAMDTAAESARTEITRRNRQLFGI
jgi:hypothetical protein